MVEEEKIINKIKKTQNTKTRHAKVQSHACSFVSFLFFLAYLRNVMGGGLCACVRLCLIMTKGGEREEKKKKKKEKKRKKGMYRR